MQTVETSKLHLNQLLQNVLKSHSLLVVSLVECLSDSFEETYVFNANQLTEEIVLSCYECYQSSIGEEHDDKTFEDWMHSKGYDCEKVVTNKIQPKKGSLGIYELVTY